MPKLTTWQKWAEERFQALANLANQFSSKLQNLTHRLELLEREAEASRIGQQPMRPSILLDTSFGGIIEIRVPEKLDIKQCRQALANFLATLPSDYSEHAPAWLRGQ